MSKIMVAFFSAGGVTAALAKRLADALNADLFEIKPEQPYTKADLDWMDKNSRSSIEMKDRSCRPAMAEKPNLTGYDTVFAAFPVWWYREPSIIDTFMESTDFTGIKVIPLCTSGSSGIGESAANIRALAPGAEVLEGKRFDARTGAEELKAWAESLIVE